MDYNKIIESGNQLELYIYEEEPKNKFGKRNSRVKRDYEAEFASVEFPNYRDNPLFKAEQVKRRQDNAKRASVAFRRIVASNLRTGENPVFCSLTFNEEYTNISLTARFFHIFTVRMRKFFGAEFRYIAVPEFQKSGRVHYHALFWGLPAHIASRERVDRTIAKLWRKGFVDCVDTDGSSKLASYMAKYMTKSMQDPRLWNCKAYFASRNILRPKVSSGVPLWWVFDEYGLDVLKPEYESEFSTHWLGQAKYKRYNLGA